MRSDTLYRPIANMLFGLGIVLLSCTQIIAEQDRRVVFARELLANANLGTSCDLRIDTTLGNPEGFTITADNAGSTDKSGTTLILGGGPAGVLYGVQEFIAGKGAIRDLSEKPDFSLRGTALFLMKDCRYDFELTPQEFPWFYDRDLLSKFLDYLFANRFNAIFLWSGNIFPSLVELPEYPDARTLSREQLLQNQEQFRWFTDQCAKRNISVLTHFYNIHLTKALAESRKIPLHYRQPDPFAAKFMHYTLKRFLTEFASVGLYVCPGEKLKSEYQPEWIRDVILKAAVDSDRNPWVVVRDWCLPGQEFKKICRYDNMFTELKHNVEMIVSPVPDPRHALWADGKNKHIVNVHEASDVKPFRWASPLFIHQMVREWKQAGLSGAEVYGRMSWRWPNTLDKLSPDQKTYWPSGPTLLTFERDAMWLEAFGRYLWKLDRNEDDEKLHWQNKLTERFGSPIAGRLLLDWYNLTGPILPGLQNLTSVINMNLNPTPIAKEQTLKNILEARKTLADDLDRNQARANTPVAPTWIYPSRPVDEYFLARYKAEYGLSDSASHFSMPVREYAEKLAKKEQIADVMTPDKVVDLLVRMADESEQLARQAEAAATMNKTDASGYITDSQAMRMIAEYYRAKITAAINRRVWEIARDTKRRDAMLEQMDESVLVYRKLVELTDRTYIMPTDLAADWSWHKGLRAAEEDRDRQKEYARTGIEPVEAPATQPAATE